MNTWCAGAASLLAALAVLNIPPAVASAHPIDELLQQVYVTPTAGHIQLAVEVLPGVAVATDFLAVVDSNGDGTMSDTEQQAFTSMLHSHVNLEVDGVTVDTEVEEAIYPDADLMIAGGGAIAISLTAVTPGNGERRVTVSDSYVPTATSGAVSKSTFQIHFTADTGLPLAVGQIERTADGRSLTTSYELDKASSSNDSVPIVPILIVTAAVLSIIGIRLATTLRRQRLRRRSLQARGASAPQAANGLICPAPR